MPSLTRRELIRVLGGAVVLAKLPACGGTAAGVFGEDDTAMLLGFADVVIPRDDQPGGAELGAIEYIARLVRAFDPPTPTPPVYAGGPYSGRQPFPDAAGQASTSFPANDFATFVELDRVSLAAWKQLLDPETGIEAQLRAGLASARAMTETPPHELSAADFQRLFDAQSDEFRALMIELVTEAAFAAPEYGGNPALAGWRMIHFEGDSLPLGYSQWNGTAHVERADAPLSTANPSDPEPMTKDLHDVLALVVAVLGGRVS